MSMLISFSFLFFHYCTKLMKVWFLLQSVPFLDSTTILLASASQDSYIRLWRISPRLEGELTPTGIIAVEQKLFTAYGRQWSVKLEAVLGAHEGWVYGIQWDWPKVEGGILVLI